MEAIKEKYLHLLETVRDKVVLLQRAAEEVEVTKRSSKGTAVNVKTQIRDSISRHLEAMRNREMWLLERVEIIQQVKEETLCQQLAELNQSLGALQNVMSMLEDNTDAIGLEAVARQVLERVDDHLKLNPIAEDHLTFSGMNFELLEMIHKFGILDSGSSQLEKQVCTFFQGLHVAESGSGISCLKKKRSFHTPAGANQDWILKEGPTEANATQTKFRPPHAKLSLTEWLPPCQSALHTQYISKFPQNTSSIEHWLCDGHRDEQPMEGMEGEPIDEKNAASENTNDDVHSLDKWLHKLDGQKIQSSYLFGYYQAVQQSDVNQWLVGNREVASCKLNTTLIGETYARIAASGPEQWLATDHITAAVPQPLRTSLIGDTYARIAASAKENWLAGKRSLEMVKRLSLEDDMSEDCSECCNFLDGVCQDGGVDFSETSSDLSEWLAVKKEDESGAPGFTMKAVDMEDVAEWLLKSWSKGKEKSSERSSTGSKKYYENRCGSSMESWLSPASTLPKFDVLRADDIGEKKYAEKHLKDSDHIWLHQPQNVQELEGSSKKITSGMSKYLGSLSGDCNQWLIRQQPGDASICKWLASSSTSTCKNCPKMSKGLFKVFDEVANKSFKTWLFPAAETM